jgi:urease accessory protein
MGSIGEHSIGEQSIGETRFSGFERDYLDIEWFNTRKKISRLRSRSGLDVGIRMGEALSARGLRQGDVVYINAGENRILLIDIVPCPCISLKPPPDLSALVRLGYEIGNRHAPLFHGESGEFLLPYDEPMKRMLESLAYKPELREARLLPEKRISGEASRFAPHGGCVHEHDHPHEHSHGEGHQH